MNNQSRLIRVHNDIWRAVKSTAAARGISMNELLAERFREDLRRVMDLQMQVAQAGGANNTQAVQTA